jgi:hypothetical protein
LDTSPNLNNDDLLQDKADGAHEDIVVPRLLMTDNILNHLHNGLAELLRYYPMAYIRLTRN